MKSKVLIKTFTVLFLYFNYSFSFFAQSDSSNRAETEILPILSYDTDTGFGYGAKAFFYNKLNIQESFDLILFNSTRGEQWYKTVFSVPDFETRQGTEFPFAVDFIFEYDKWKNYNLYYYSRNSLEQSDQQDDYTDKCVYEFIDARVLFNLALRKDITGWLGIKFNSIASYNYQRDSEIDSPAIVKNPFLKTPSVKYLSANLNCKWDTRNSYINPSNGYVFEMELEYAPDIFSEDNSFFREAFVIRYFHKIFIDDLVFAGRAMEQIIISESGSSQFLAIPVGGNNTLRGVSVDKFRFKSVLLFNNELRYQFWWRFGFITGLDIGYGSNKYLYPEKKINWIITPVIGLRFFMDNFIVRADVGYYKNDIGFYLNFGHIY